MTRIVLPENLDNIEVTQPKYEAMPAGVYELEVDNVEQKTSGNGPYLNLTLKVIDHEDYAGRKVWDILSLLPQALFKIKQFSLASGIQISDEFDTEDLLGAQVVAVLDVEDSTKIDEETGNPIQRNVVKYYKF